MKKRNLGFTLVECLVVIAALAILVAVFVPMLPPMWAQKNKMSKSGDGAEREADATLDNPHPTPFGHDIYYFTNVGMYFPYALSKFLDNHPEYSEVTTAVPNVVRLNRRDLQSETSVAYGQYDYGAAVGYTVIFKLKEPAK